MPLKYKKIWEFKVHYNSYKFLWGIKNSLTCYPANIYLLKVNNRNYCAPSRKKIIPFLCTKYFFDAASSCCCRHETLFCATSTFFLLTWNTFSCNINAFLSTPNYFLCNVKLFVSTQLYFWCNTKFLLRTSFRMLCHDDIFLFSYSNKNIITCQKINKLSFLCETKKLVSFLCASQFFCITVFRLHIVGKLIFFVVVLETKKLLIHVLLTCLIIVIKTER